MAARYLMHLRDAWDEAMAADSGSAQLSEQEVLLTVPASFDAVARELTVREVDGAGFTTLAYEFTRERAEIHHASWIGPRRSLKATYWPLLFQAEQSLRETTVGPSLPVAGADSEPERRRRVWDTRSSLPHMKHTDNSHMPKGPTCEVDPV